MRVTRASEGRMIGTMLVLVESVWLVRRLAVCVVSRAGAQPTSTMDSPGQPASHSQWS